MSAKEDFNMQIGADKTAQLDYILRHFKKSNFGKYAGMMLGFDRLYRELFLTKVFDRYIAQNPDYPLQYFCALTKFDQESWDACVGKQSIVDAVVEFIA